MQRILILGSLGLAAAALGVTTFSEVDHRLERLDAYRREAPRKIVELESDLETLSTQLGELRLTLQQLETLGQLTGEMRSRLGHLEQELTETLTEQEGTLSELETRLAIYGPDNIEGRISEIEAGMDDRFNGISETVTAAVQIAEETKLEVARTGLGGDKSVRWREIVGPTVQLAGDSTVGSGVLLKSRLLEDEADGEAKFETLLLTAWHVVRDIRADSLDANPSIPVSIYLEGGGVIHEAADLLAHDADLDAALLRLHTNREIANGAQLPSREHLEEMQIFASIYAVGCPLGNDPIPTSGEIADTRHLVDGNLYWMISAPTYIGNSGGGIYDSETRELLGIFSKIYTHGSLSPTVVPHMGLVTPLSQIYDWIEGEGYALTAQDSGVQLAAAK